MASTIGSAGRYGTRYGARLRKKINLVESEQKKKHICPRCNDEKVKREAKGIWLCKKCKYKFAGAAYTPFKQIEVTGKKDGNL